MATKIDCLSNFINILALSSRMPSSFFLGPDTPLCYAGKINMELMAFLITPEDAARQFISHYGSSKNIGFEYLTKFYDKQQNTLSKSQKTRQMNINRKLIETLKKEGKYTKFIK